MLRSAPRLNNPICKPASDQSKNHINVELARAYAVTQEYFSTIQQVVPNGAILTIKFLVSV